MKKVYAKEELCLNCRLCEAYCRTAHSKSKDILKAHLRENPPPVSRISVAGDNMDSVAVNCRHCDNPACVAACITGAMQKNPETGLVFCDESRCIGCMTCLAVCPVGCISAGETAVKCDLCQGETEPACVKNCPNKALVYVDVTGGAK